MAIKAPSGMTKLLSQPQRIAIIITNNGSSRVVANLIIAVAFAALEKGGVDEVFDETMIEVVDRRGC